MSRERVVTVMRAEAVVRTPWKNGGGVTAQLAIWPQGADFARGEFDARVSSAEVGRAGPFSEFPGFERVLVVVAGAGLIVSHGEHAPRARLRPLEPYRFAGEWPTQGDLVDGAVRDFNVFTCRGLLRADVEAARLGQRTLRSPLEARHALAYVVAGAAVARVSGEEEPFELAAGDSLRIDEARANDELELRGADASAIVIVARLRSVSA